VNAALLILFPPATLGSEIQIVTSGTRFGRCTLEAPDKKPPNGFCPVTTFTGGAVRA
jgi:hypothetical protein